MHDPGERIDRLRSHLAQVLREPATDDELLPITESLGGGVADRETELALTGLEHVRAGDELSLDEADAIEAIVLPRERPVVDVVDDSFGDIPSPWQHLGVGDARTRIEATIPSIGRVEVIGRPDLPYGGTGFVVGDGLLMTNRHVAALFTTGVGSAAQLRFIAGISAGVDFAREFGSAGGTVLDVRRVLMVHPFWDCALLEVDGLTERHAALSLAATEPARFADDIVVIGYPARDPRNDAALQDRIFGGKYQHKRLQPGRLVTYRTVRSFGNDVEAVTHDSSTLGGNSGSAVIDPATGLVVGLHFAGRYLDANFAVPAWELATDQRVVDAGVSFEPAATPAGPPAWHHAWAGVEPRRRAPRPVRLSTPSDVAGAPARLRPSGESLALPLDWYERIDDAMLADSLQRDLEGTRARLVAVLGEEEADELIEDLMATEEEWLFGRDVDPDLPQIIYLHGIMGGHLAEAGGTGSRVWLNPLTLLVGNSANKMMLGADGVTDAQRKLRLGPDGHIRLYYARATRKWRRRGFVVHEITYDWRKPLASSADRLHALIESFAAGNPEQRFVIAAHSMGGLVASTYAARHPEWDDRIDRAVFAGTPLGGSYAPIEAVLGVYPLLRTLAKVALTDDVAEFRLLCAGLPGLLEMLPSPDLFDDELDCFATSSWPTASVPAAPWLDAARDFKSLILGSPLLARTTGIVSRRHGTVARTTVADDGKLGVGPATAPGDGTVPIQASAVAELERVFEGASARHSDLMKDGAVISGMAQLFAGEQPTDLTPLDRASIDLDVVIETPIESPDVLESLATARAEEVRANAAAGRLTAEDVRFLFDPAADLGLA